MNGSQRNGRESVPAIQPVVRFLEGQGWQEISGGKEHRFRLPGTTIMIRVPRGRGQLTNGTWSNIRSGLKTVYEPRNQQVVVHGSELRLVDLSEDVMKKATSNGLANHDTPPTEAVPEVASVTRSVDGLGMLTASLGLVVKEEMDKQVLALVDKHLNTVEQLARDLVETETSQHAQRFEEGQIALQELATKQQDTRERMETFLGAFLDRLTEVERKLSFLLEQQPRLCFQSDLATCREEAESTRTDLRTRIDRLDTRVEQQAEVLLAEVTRIDTRTVAHREEAATIWTDLRTRIDRVDTRGEQQAEVVLAETTRIDAQTQAALSEVQEIKQGFFYRLEQFVRRFLGEFSGRNQPRARG